MATSGYDGATFEEPEGDPSVWKVWLTRILVTAAIALVLERLGKQPAPQLTKQQEEGAGEEESEVASMRYAELSAGGEKNGEEQQGMDAGECDQLHSQDAPSKGAALNPPEKARSESDVSSAIASDNDEQEREESGQEQKEQKENAEPKTKEPAKKKKDDKSATDASDSEPPSNSVHFRNKSPGHPGMDGFHNWYDIETSLFRQYTVGRSDGVDALPAYVPKSRGGLVRVALRVTNNLTDSHRGQYINVYWMNYTGHEESKGSIHRGETWTQTTWVEHPWVFRLNDTNELLLHYIPERVIPSLDEAPTVEDGNALVGVQRMTFTPPTDQAQREHHICSIEDRIMPHPGRHHFHNPDQAHTWTLLHMKRLEYFAYNHGATLLKKYLTNIAMNPDKANFRQIRIANRNFYQGIWQTPARGLLLAAGFVEEHANAELGTEAPLPGERVQDVSLVLFRLEQYLTELEQEADATATTVFHQQPEGADGYGRAGYGRAGQMNSRN